MVVTLAQHLAPGIRAAIGAQLGAAPPPQRRRPWMSIERKKLKLWPKAIIVRALLDEQERVANGEIPSRTFLVLQGETASAAWNWLYASRLYNKIKWMELALKYGASGVS